MVEVYFTTIQATMTLVGSSGAWVALWRPNPKETSC